jgi:pyruvate dehydrogenase E1 component alpha subunit
VERARSGLGPSLIEARTWRWRGHWAGDDQVYRPLDSEPADVEDPLDLYAHRLLAAGTVTLDELQQIHRDVEAEVQTAMERAHAAHDPGLADLGFEDVYA